MCLSDAQYDRKIGYIHEETYEKGPIAICILNTSSNFVNLMQITFNSIMFNCITTDSK